MPCRPYFSRFPRLYDRWGYWECWVMEGVPQPYPSTMPMSSRFRYRFHSGAPLYFVPRSLMALRADSEGLRLRSPPSRITAPGQLGARSLAVLPRPLPPEVAKRTMVFPAKS